MTKSANKGDGISVEWICDALFGKEIIKQEVDITSQGGSVQGPVIYIPSNGREAEAQKQNENKQSE